jgi:hypothetical protein
MAGIYIFERHINRLEEPRPGILAEPAGIGQLVTAAACR